MLVDTLLTFFVVRYLWRYPLWLCVLATGFFLVIDVAFFSATLLKIALTHHLVTKYTSLVAVDRAPARPDGAALKEAALPTNLPDGWTYDAVFGELPRGATDARFNLLLGALLLLAATLAFGMRRRFAS